jgi:hypothetical protein
LKIPVKTCWAGVAGNARASRMVRRQSRQLPWIKAWLSSAFGSARRLARQHVQAIIGY